VYSPRTLDDSLAKQLGQPRFRTHLLVGFAILAFLLAMAGIYGVVSFQVGQRTHEMGIRIALGASHGRVLRMMIWQGMMPTLIGLGFGLLSSIGLSQFLSAMLYGIRPLDPVTYVGSSILLAGCSLVASYIPTRRVMQLDPSQALRWE
ncbi:MAG: FtsX-like permease family protein, partial [Pyrinomonadaceae bacterium]